MNEFQCDHQHSPLVSIIVPTYNYSAYISEILDNLLKQSYQCWEAIIVDDGSTDHTGEIIKKYSKHDKRFVYFYQENKGLSAARNTGLSLAKGKYIQFLDADDLLSERKLEVQVFYMEEHPEIAVGYNIAKYFEDLDIHKLYWNIHLTQDKWMCQQSGTLKELMPYFIKENILPVNSALVSHSFLKINNILFDTEYQSLEDWHFWVHCLSKGASFNFIDNQDAYALVRVHTGSMSKNTFFMSVYYLKLACYIDRVLRRNTFLEGYKILRKQNKEAMKYCFRYLVNENNKINWHNWSVVRSRIPWFYSIFFLSKELNRIRKMRNGTLMA